MLRAKYGIALCAALLGALALGLLSCGGKGGGGGGPSGPPFIAAELDSFPPGAAPPGFTSNAFVEVLNSDGNSITNATVTLNAVTLTYDAVNADYEGNVVVNPGDRITLSVTTGGATYTASANQFTSYPTISAPAPSDTWDSHVTNTATWSGGAPTVGAEYVIGMLDTADPDGEVQWPPSNFLMEVPIGAGTISLPIQAFDIPAGDRTLIVGISSSTPIANADPQSAFVVQGFNFVPITVTGLPVTVRTMGAAIAPRGVAWSNSQFVAVGAKDAGFGVAAHSAILTSPDGITWTSRVSSTSQVLNSVIGSGTQFVAVGFNGTIVTSPDGISWTTRLAGFSVAGTPEPFNGIAWSGSAFVVVGSFGTILTSPDGIKWTSQTSGISTFLGAVVWSGTQFVAVGAGGVILTSPDGTTWTAQSGGPPASGLVGVAWSGAQFAAVGLNTTPCCSDLILTSPDGVTWTPRSSGTSADPQAVVWAGTQFVAVGQSFPNGTVITSPDGVTWTRQASGTAGILTGVAWSGTTLVAVGQTTVNGIVGGGGVVLTSP